MFVKGTRNLKSCVYIVRITDKDPNLQLKPC